MEKERVRDYEEVPYKFIQTVKMAQQGDVNSMDEILDFFRVEIESLSKFLMLPREEAIQSLKTELICIIYEQL